MIFCKDCCEVFDEDDVIRTKNYVPWGSVEVVESITVECPHCHSSELEYDAEIINCDGCGRVMLENDANYDSDTDKCYCNRCWEELE